MIIPPDKKDQNNEVRTEHVAQRDEARAVGVPGSSRNEAAPASPNQRHRAIDLHTPAPNAEASDDELAPLLPPPYSEAAAGSEKDRRRRRLQQTLVAVATAVIWFGLLLFIVLRSRVVKYRDVWTRNGADGHGAFDHAWQHRTPLLSMERYPRECDMFSDPSASPPFSRPISAGDMYQSWANYTLTLPLKKLSLHVRGPVYGAVVVDASTEEPEERKTNAYHIQVMTMFADESSMAGWHACRFGAKDEQGVVLVGPVDEKRSTSPWDPNFKKLDVYVRLPSVQPGTRVHRADGIWHIGDIELDIGDMELNWLGNMRAQDLSFNAVEVSVGAANAIVSGVSRLGAGSGEAKTAQQAPPQHLVAERVAIDVMQGAIGAAAIETSSWLSLNSRKGLVECGDCTASSIVVHTSDGSVGGRYRATDGLDVFTSNRDIVGEFQAADLWLRNANADIRGSITVIEKDGTRSNSLLAATRLGTIDLALDYKALEVTGATIGVSPAEAAPIFMHTTLGGVRLDVRSLPRRRGITVDVSSREAPLRLSMPSDFEGDFSLATTSKQPVVRVRDSSRRLSLASGPDSGVVTGNITRVNPAKRDRAGLLWDHLNGDTTSKDVILEL